MKPGKKLRARRPLWPTGRNGKTDGRKDGCLEIPPCVLQDSGPFRPLPKKAKYAATKSRAGE